MSSRVSKLAVIGLGKLGCPMAAVFAEAGFEVSGFDVSESVVACLGSGRSPYPEPGLQEKLDEFGGRLSFSNDIAEAVTGADASFVIVPTPSDESGTFTNRYVIEAVQAIGAVLRKQPQRDHLVVVTSTVMPGSTMGVIKESLESAADRAVGDHLGLCYSPEFIALGSVIRDMQYPDTILIGQSDERSGDLLEFILRGSVKNSPAVCRMAPVNAEVAKLSINCFVTMKISFANKLAEYCEALPEGDIDEVTKALGCDSRIGSKYLKGGLGFGGPCFPRDNAALVAATREVGQAFELSTATSGINARQLDRMLGMIAERLESGKTIGIIGLSYKPNTPVIEQSHSALLATKLVELGYKVAAFDPLVFESKHELDEHIESVPTLSACVRSCDALVIADPSLDSAGELRGELARAERLDVVFDCWRTLNTDALRSGTELVAIGIGSRIPSDSI